MRRYQKWLLAALVVVGLVGTTLIIDLASSRAVVADERGPSDHWRHFDGHWSYWHDGDRRWYYTDGLHWYYYTPAGWVLYHFDKVFGKGFHHGEYVVPGEHVKIEPPRHKVYHIR